MKKLAMIAVAGLLGLGLATAADAQQKPMGASGSSMSSGAPAKSAAKMPAKKSSAKKASTGSASVKAVQEALNKNGASLKIDGKMGPGTRAALKKYQSANGLKATGRVDAATKTKLGV